MTSQDFTNMKYIGMWANRMRAEIVRNSIRYAERQWLRSMREIGFRVETGMDIEWSTGTSKGKDGTAREYRYSPRIVGRMVTPEFFDNALATHPVPTVLVPSYLYSEIRKWPEVEESGFREIMELGLFGIWRGGDACFAVAKCEDDFTGVLLVPRPLSEFHASRKADLLEYQTRVVDERCFQPYSQKNKGLAGLRCEVKRQGFKGRISREITKSCVLVDIAGVPYVVDKNDLKVFYL